MGRTLVITNDFPPRPGGIQTFGYEIVRRFDPESVTVLTSNWEGAAEFDAAQDFKIVRANTQTLVPSKSTLSMARQIVVAENITRVLFGAAAPLAISARFLRVRRIVPGVDSTEFSPDNLSSGNQLRTELGWIDRPVIVCVSRLMARKGQDELIRALPKIHQTAPNASLIIVGDGPYRKDIERLVKKLELENFVHLTGKVSQTELSKWYAAGDIFAMPCRTRMGGWDVEGLGIVFLEGSATGLPVIVGDSGGAVDAVIDGETGYLVDGTNTAEIAGRIAYLFANPDIAKKMGEAGRNWVTQEWTWDQNFKKLDGLLSGLDFSD